MDWSATLAGFEAIPAQFDLVLALVGYGLASAVPRKGISFAALIVFLIANACAALGGHQLISRIQSDIVNLANGPSLGATANLISGAALLAPGVIAVPFLFVAGLANGLIVGMLIAMKALGGPGELAFTAGALIASVSIVAVAMLARRETLKAPWAQIASRIAGAWLIAIGILVLALPTARKHPQSDFPVAIPSPLPPKAFRSVIPP
jgi:hypothetical protein